MNRNDEVIKKLDTGPPSSSRMLGDTPVAFELPRLI